MQGAGIVVILNYLFLFYSIALFGSYLIIGLVSIAELYKYINENKHFDSKVMLKFSKLPSVSVIAPAYNEEKTIIENVKCLLSLQYPSYEIIIVNDGSKDQTLQSVIDYFDLIPVVRAYDIDIPCNEIKTVYQSRILAYSNLFVVDKVNGGKADALNSGINIAHNELFLAMDVDCVVQSDALLRMVKPFIETTDREVIASGGVVRIANSCEVKNGHITKVNFPTNWWARFQVIEYFRAFSMGRMAWRRINGLLLISGAFGLFSRKRVIQVGGYDSTSIGEDFELVVRMRRYMYEVERKKHKVAFIPDPLCWTEVPESFRVLSRQRNRWTRGNIDTLLKHRKMLLNPRFGVIGLISYPYWLLFEWMAPLIELFGIVIVLLLVYLGMVNVSKFILLTVFIASFTLMYSMNAVFYEAFTFNKYRGFKYVLIAICCSIMEMFIFHPLNIIFAVAGNIDYFFLKKKVGER